MFNRIEIPEAHVNTGQQWARESNLVSGWLVPAGHDVRPMIGSLAQSMKSLSRRKYTDLPPNYSAINSAIQKSHIMLSWEDNWDGEGSISYNESTWNIAKDFILKNVMSLWNDYKKVVPIPQITPGPDGSIDIHWRGGDKELLINIPANLSEEITFYGDNHNVDIKGSIKSPSNEVWILVWLAV